MRIFDIPIAHRGLHDENSTENSMSAFKKALEKGYNIEIDVRLLKDNQVVIMHDRTINRIIKKKGKISNLTSKDLENPEYFLPCGEKIPLLSELLELVNGKVDILCEIKSTSYYSFKLEEEVYKLIKGKPWVAIQSFNPKTVKWFNDNANEVLRGQLATKSKGAVKFLYNFYGPYKSLELGKPQFLAYNIEHLPSARIATAVKDYKMKLLTWTVQSEKNIKTAIECNVDNIIFETVSPEEFIKGKHRRAEPIRF